MTEQEFTELYANGFARTVKVFLKFLDQPEAEDWAQEVFTRLWERRDNWQKDYSIVSFWHLQVRDVIFDLRKSFKQTIEFEMFDGEDNVVDYNLDMEIDAERIAHRIDPDVLDALWMKVQGFTHHEILAHICEARGEKISRQALEKRIERFFAACPDIVEDAKEVVSRR